MSIGTGMIFLVIPLLTVELTGSYSIAGLAFAMVGAGTLIADIPAGFFISRVGIKPAMLLGIFLFSGSAFFAGFIQSAMAIAVAGFFLGAGRGLVVLSRMTYIADVIVDERGRAMAVAGGMVRVGMLLGPIIGGFTAKYVGHGTSLIVAGLISLVSIMFFGFLIVPENVVIRKHKINPLKSVGDILTRYRSIFLTAGFAMIGLALLRSSRMLLIPLWGKSIGLDAAEIGLITGIPIGLELTMFYPVGMIMDRYGRKWTAVPCIAILAITFMIIPQCHTYSSLLIVSLFAGIGNGIGSGIFLTLGADFSPSTDRSDFLGVWRLIGDVGNTTGPFLLGTLTEIFALSLASMIIGIIGLLSAAVMLVFVEESKTYVQG